MCVCVFFPIYSGDSPTDQGAKYNNTYRHVERREREDSDILEAMRWNQDVERTAATLWFAVY